MMNRAAAKLVSWSFYTSLGPALSGTRCSYCALGTGFRRHRIRPMKAFSNGLQIYENCGHIVFPNDGAFKRVATRVISTSCSLRDISSAHLSSNS